MKNFARNSELDEFLRQEIADSGYGGVDVLKTPVGTRITIFVTRPGLVIGRRGVGIKSLTEKIDQKFELQNPQISVLEIEVPELDPNVMANKIVHTVRRGTAFRRAALWTLRSIMNAGAMGAEISISGKLRSERSHHEKYREGVVPKSGETAKKMVREATQDVLLKMGLYGINIKIALKDFIPEEVKILDAKTAEANVKEIQPSDAESFPKISIKSSKSNSELEPKIKTKEKPKELLNQKTKPEKEKKAKRKNKEDEDKEIIKKPSKGKKKSISKKSKEESKVEKA